jgi:hypothetical protein
MAWIFCSFSKLAVLEFNHFERPRRRSEGLGPGLWRFWRHKFRFLAVFLGARGISKGWHICQYFETPIRVLAFS